LDEAVRPLASIANACLMTVILLSSSLTMLGAGAAARAGQAARCVRWVGVTMFLGVLFAALHLREWFAMFHEGWGLGHNPLGGAALVGSTFFGITGLHLLHVVSGVIALGVVAWRFRRGRLAAEHIETVGLYWHFVDLVWMFVFPAGLSPERPLKRRPRHEHEDVRDGVAGHDRPGWRRSVGDVCASSPGTLLATLLALALVEAAVALLYFMHLKYERRALLWWTVPLVVFALVMLDHVWPDALRLASLRLH